MSRRNIINTRDLSPERPLISDVDSNRKTGNGKATFKTATAAANAAKAAAEEAKAAAEEAEKQVAVAVRAASSAAAYKRECEVIITDRWERLEAHHRERDWALFWSFIAAMAAFLFSPFFLD